MTRGGGYVEYATGITRSQFAMLVSLPITFNVDVDDKDATVFYSNEDYSKDDVINALNSMNPYISKGIMNFMGDVETWRFKFNKSTETWIEEQGKTYFNDEDMIRELVKHGYTVTKTE